jgi:hypothetical protein
MILFLITITLVSYTLFILYKIKMKIKMDIGIITYSIAFNEIGVLKSENILICFILAHNRSR